MILNMDKIQFESRAEIKASSARDKTRYIEESKQKAAQKTA